MGTAQRCVHFISFVKIAVLSLRIRFQAFGGLINSVIHCIMYSHYFFTSLGYENPFKKLITQVQLVQFAMCILHALCVLGFEVVLPRPYAWAQFVYHIQVWSFFTR